MTDSVKQYLDLWRDHRDDITAPSPAAMNAVRGDAAAALERLGLPRRGDEGYTEADVDAMFAPDMGINLKRLPFRADLAAAFRCQVPNITTLMGVVANDMYAPTSTLQRNLPQGVTVCTFAQAPQLLPGVLERYYNNIAPQTGAVALNTLLAQDGVLVHVSRDVECAKPIQLVNVTGGVNTPMLVFRRLLVVLESGARASVLTCDHSGDNLANTTNAVVEVDLGPGSHLDYSDLEESTTATRRYAAITARLAAGARLDCNVTTLACGTTRNDIRVELEGQDAECRLTGIAIADGNQLADNSATVLHNASHCRSDQMFKYVVDQDARGAFQGLIKVAAGAVKTEAYQNNRNVLAAPSARMHTQPQLEIYCDDVRANHGAATGQIDERALFYMQSRGIPRTEARTMLMQAFMADVIDSVAIAPLRDRLRHLVEQRLSGHALNCQTCNP